MQLIHKGSVKDVYRIDADDQYLLFDFSDRYSIFDWGTMPDEIAKKGKALARFTCSLYRKLEAPEFWKQYLSHGDALAEELKSVGLRTHICSIGCEENQMVVQEVPCPRNDLNSYQAAPTNAFIPLEVIFRLGVPAGSSLLERHADRYYAGQRLEQPLIEHSTKWERVDRMLNETEAMTLAGLKAPEFKRLNQLTSCLGIALNSLFAGANLKLWDGKVEWAFVKRGNRRDFMLVDSIGPDELRLSYGDIPFSKEFLRQWYRKTPWFKELKGAKNIFSNDFKKHCCDPTHLPPEMLQDVSQMYEALGQTIEGTKICKGLLLKLERWL